MIALTSMLGVMTSGMVARFDPATGEARPDVPRRSVTRLHVFIATEWLSPTRARSNLEARSTALKQWLRARDGSAQVLSSRSLLRTHGPDGGRLATPQARFERILEIQVPEQTALEHMPRALLGPDDKLAVAGDQGTYYGQPPHTDPVDFQSSN